MLNYVQNSLLQLAQQYRLLLLKVRKSLLQNVRSIYLQKMFFFCIVLKEDMGIEPLNLAPDQLHGSL